MHTLPNAFTRKAVGEFLLHTIPDHKMHRNMIDCARPAPWRLSTLLQHTWHARTGATTAGSHLRAYFPCRQRRVHPPLHVRSHFSFSGVSCTPPSLLPHVQEYSSRRAVPQKMGEGGGCLVGVFQGRYACTSTSWALGDAVPGFFCSLVL